MCVCVKVLLCSAHVALRCLVFGLASFCFCFASTQNNKATTRSDAAGVLFAEKRLQNGKKTSKLNKNVVFAGGAKTAKHSIVLELTVSRFCFLLLFPVCRDHASPYCVRRARSTRARRTQYEETGGR